MTVEFDLISLPPEEEEDPCALPPMTFAWAILADGVWVYENRLPATEADLASGDEFGDLILGPTVPQYLRDGMTFLSTSHDVNVSPDFTDLFNAHYGTTATVAEPHLMVSPELQARLKWASDRVNVATRILDLSALDTPAHACPLMYPEDPRMRYKFGFKLAGMNGVYWQRSIAIAPARDLASPEAFAAQITSDKARPPFLVEELTSTVHANGQINIWFRYWSYMKRMATAYINRNKDVEEVWLNISPSLQRALGWATGTFTLSSTALLPEWPADCPVDSLPPEMMPVDPNPPAAPPPPASCPSVPVTHCPVNVFCEGVETSKFMRGEVKPFVDTMCLETHGGQLSDRPYATPLTWMPPPTPGRLRELIMWVEDDEGQLYFPPDSRMAILATWRTYSTLTEDPTREDNRVHGRMVVEFDGEEGTWEDMTDYGGRFMVKGTRSYEVAALTVTVTATGPAPAAWAISADGWLEDEGSLVVVPPEVCRPLPSRGPTGFSSGGPATPPSGGPPPSSGGPAATDPTTVYTFTPPRPLYKRIRPECRSQILFRVTPLLATGVTVLSTKLVLRVRKCLTK
jgi:hypothetical protein